MLNKKEGITLIALVVTIIILLILAGITLALVSGENGILKRTTNAVEINEKASAEEEADLLIADLVAQYYEEKYVNHKEELETVDDYIKNQLTKEKETEGDYGVKYNEKTGKIEVSKEGQIISSGVIENGKVEWEEENGSTGGNDESYEEKIEYTAIAIGTSESASNTSSVEDNSQTKGTKLYINIIAQLEGTACTVTLKEDSTKSVPYAITRNGKYTFIVTGTYQGKTVRAEKEVTVSKYHAAKDLVQYDAGDWTLEEIEELNNKQLYVLNATKKHNEIFRLLNPTDENALNFTFGGFTYKGDTEHQELINNGTIATSRNQSISSFYGSTEYTPQYDGWQLLETETKQDENGNIIKNADGTDRIYVKKIVHAGSPENYVFWGRNTNDAYRSEYILSSGLRQTNYNKLYDGTTTLNPRSWQMYVDDKQKDLIADITDKDGNTVKDIHAMDYNEALSITGNTNGTNGIRNTGAHYWLGTPGRDDCLRFVHNSGHLDYYTYGFCLGVRPVVSLKSGVYIKSGEGIAASPYVLGIE